MTQDLKGMVKIKPLEWGQTSYGTPEAISVAGVYRISGAWDGGWKVTAKGSLLRSKDGRTSFATMDGAKATAQADYEARILSALAHVRFLDELSNAARDVLAERRRQIEVEGWTAEHDDAHRGGEMAEAGATYALAANVPYMLIPVSRGMGFWPWSFKWFKRGTPCRMLVEGAALIVAEIERLDRKEAAALTHASEG